MSHLINIGNSQGIRIPKAVINQAGLENVELVLTVVPEGLLISPVQAKRQGWAEACKSMSEEKEDKLLLKDSVINQFDKDFWEW